MTAGALMVSAPASGHGKTTVTAALARAWRDAGLAVRIFKTGPDFLDPMILARATGSPVYPLDLWMGGPGHCAALLYRAAREADVVLVEGAMGLYDGTPSSADLAVRFGLPVLAVIDASAMAQTFGALAHGLATWRPAPGLAGVVANRTGGAVHARMLRDSLPPGLRFYGALPRDAACALPSRHLGLALPEGTLRGQTFHHARAGLRIAPAAHTRAAQDHGRPEPVWRSGRLVASFLHLYFPSNPDAVAALLRP
jgi:cobyrinic acid a,c-diamide synthase